MFHLHRRKKILLLALLAGIAIVIGVVWLGYRLYDVRHETDYRKLPRWRGFNLLEKFYVTNNQPFREKDFQLIQRLGFDFVRLPMDYRCWIRSGNWEDFDEDALREIDQAVAWGECYRIHVCLNFHRAPGYTVASPPEKTNLWSDANAQKVCAKHWGMFARRYHGISNTRLSFNLFNEPVGVDGPTYARVVNLMLVAIHAEDPQRLVICDGLEWGSKPCQELMPLKVAQATRGYQPFTLTHYKANWVGNQEKWPAPHWPIAQAEEWFRREMEPWQKLQASGIGVMVGEWGSFRFTPHEMVLRWMEDCLKMWKKAGWGWALWNFRGSFGILDSDRGDVQYEEWEGHKLDRKMLRLLQSY